ncbi:hypothetical protein PBI_KAMPE_112 [Gordonia phage Kampe]|uniref:Uncharacterized protein n=3 Tax=Gordonia phage Orchid TaxID=1838075 RepID=A0A160DHA0_9CAUD|nr:hypothetical protein BH761_gp102 [Gordonia phage Orchid]ANA87344.1 hypothetical protein PBI_PATRICKSTAR_112 [Gordonia phage PatrickStar]ANA87455.1 hypothetical protein PBI_ORCHID_111 [Gordonia phage Orchid]ANA87570.1 hypothetical protein PBI_KAMPE_112 [Gordonia phage Kampe]AXH46566.1 hypothetical protein SEA_ROBINSPARKLES_121 [Gordonia phage RobinSparkles]
MARNSYYNGERPIALEFNTVVGTDCLMWVDGRISQENADQKVVDKAKQLRKRRPHLQLEGYTKMGSDIYRKLPSHVINQANKD